MTCDGAFYPQPSWERRISASDFGSLLPTPASQEAGWKVGGSVEVVDRNGDPPAHPNQRFYDKATGRVVQKGLTQVLQMFPTPTTPSGGGTGRSGKRINEVPSLHGMASRGMWPTPRAHETVDLPKGTRAGNGADNLATAVARQMRQTLPTPTVQDAENNGSQSQSNRNTPPLNAVAGGKLNPTWVEWLMGWPPGWTDLEPLATDRYQSWLQQHGCC
jgi:DNA (cytosine-5)-methyltransferase 1